MDVTEFLFAAIEEVVFTLVITLLLVFLVVYVFLQDFRSTLIPMIAVPVALIGTFLFLWLFGFSINLLVLSALLLAIAIVVDDAIVVVEAVHAKLDQGYKSALPSVRVTPPAVTITDPRGTLYAPSEITPADEPLYCPVSWNLFFSAICFAAVLVVSYSSVKAYFSALSALTPCVTR